MRDPAVDDDAARYYTHHDVMYDGDLLYVWWLTQHHRIIHIRGDSKYICTSIISERRICDRSIYRGFNHVYYAINNARFSEKRSCYMPFSLFLPLFLKIVDLNHLIWKNPIWYFEVLFWILTSFNNCQREVSLGGINRMTFFSDFLVGTTISNELFRRQIKKRRRKKKNSVIRKSWIKLNYSHETFDNAI
jgi:hypothetical protein